MVNYNPFVFHCYEDIEPLIFLGHDVDLLGSRDVIGYVTIRLDNVGICHFLLVVHCNHASILHRYGDYNA